MERKNIIIHSRHTHTQCVYRPSHIVNAKHHDSRKWRSGGCIYIGCWMCSAANISPYNPVYISAVLYRDEGAVLCV